MSFSIKTWMNRISEFPNRRRLDSTGIENTYDVVRSEGDVTAEGDKVDAPTMNDLENRIAAAFEDTASATHVHGNLTNDGKIGSASGKIVTTGTGGAVQAQSIADAGLVASPSAVSGTGAITVTVAENKEYSFTAVTSLTMTGAAVGCHGFITFAASAPTISVSGFTAAGGDDITEAAASEVWEFSVYAHNSGSYIVWKNWSA